MSREAGSVPSAKKARSNGSTPMPVPPAVVSPDVTEEVDRAPVSEDDPESKMQHANLAAATDPATLLEHYNVLLAKQANGRALCWQHLDPLLIQDADDIPTALKLRCKHCGNLFSALNPSRTVADHIKACRSYTGSPIPRVRHQSTRAKSTSGVTTHGTSIPQSILSQAGVSQVFAAISSTSAPAREQSAQAALDALSRTALQLMQPALELPAIASPRSSIAAKAAFYRPPSHDPRHIEMRQMPLRLGRSALLFVDIQNYNCSPAGVLASQMQGDMTYFWRRLHEATPLWLTLSITAHACNIEVIYTVIQSLTRDGRDRGLDYKLSGFHVPPGCWDAQVIDAVKPGADDIVLPKSSSSVFNSTMLASILRNMGIEQVAVCGALTDQCVDHAIRDGADLGLLMTQITDACVTYSDERHSGSIDLISGYCRQRTSHQLMDEMRSAANKPD